MTMPGTPAPGTAIPEVDPLEAHDLLGAGALIVDVREAWELQEARIAGCLHIPLMELPGRIDEVPQDQTLLLFCKSGARSWHASRLLLQAGHKDVLNVRGGLIAWHRAGLPLEIGAQP